MVRYSSFSKELHEIINKKKRIMLLWKKVKDYIEYNSEFLFFYKWFNRHFINNGDSLSEEEIAELFNKKENVSLKSTDVVKEIQNLNKIVFYSDSITIHLNMDKNHIGEVIRVSKGCKNKTGYHKNEIIGKNIEILMPSFMKDKHTQILKNFTRTGKRFTDGQIGSFLRTKEGYLKRVNVMLKLIYSMKGTIEFVGLMRSVQTKSSDKVEYVILDDTGFIGGAS